MKYQFMQAHAQKFSVERMSKVFKVSRSGYYRFVRAKPSWRSLDDQQLLSKIAVIHEDSRQTYGSPRVHAELRAGGEKCSRNRFCKLMRVAGIVAKMHKRFKVTTRRNPKAVAAPNLLQQDFTAEFPNQRWVADFSYVATQEGWLYVAVVLVLYSRYIVGLTMQAHMTASLVIAALQQAVTHRKPSVGLIHHSDQGSQYTSQAFKRVTEQQGIALSMSGVGNCYDNAAAESFLHTLKTEHVYFEHYETQEQAKQSIFEYIMVFYNRKRRHSTLNYVSPVEFENSRQQQLEGFSS
jgi:putative transposase